MGALSPSSPKQSPAFRACPHHQPPHAPVFRGLREHGGVGPELGWGRGRAGSILPSLRQAGEMGTWRVEAPAGRAGAACEQSWRREGTQPAPSSAQLTQLGLAATSPPPTTAGLIYAEAHRHTLIYAAPHMAWGADMPRHRGCPRSTDLRVCHHPLADVPAYPPSTQPPFPLLYPLYQPQPAQHHSTPRPLPSLPPAAPTQVITSWHLL